MKKKNFNAIECKQNDKSFYIASIDNKTLKDICFISRVDEDREKGFQRLLNETRARKIAQYLDEDKMTIPSALILSAQKKAKLEYKNGKINFEPLKDSFLVIDGQHRLYGYFLSKKLYDVPVVIYNKLELTDEVVLFVDINTTQKGVPAAMLLDIKRLTGKESTIEEKQRKLFDLLNEESVLSGLLSPTISVTGKISRKAFNDSTKTVFTDSFFNNENDIQIIYKAVKNYLKAVELVLNDSKSKNARLNKMVIFKSVFKIFNHVVTSCLNEHYDLKVNSLIKILEPISVINYDSYVGTSGALIAKIEKDMMKELQKRPEFKEDMF